jgi:hypothetical protein
MLVLRGGPAIISRLPKPHPRPNLKVSNFEQTIAARMCCFDGHRGIALSGPIQRYQALFGLVALCVLRERAK